MKQNKMTYPYYLFGLALMALISFGLFRVIGLIINQGQIERPGTVKLALTYGLIHDFTVVVYLLMPSFIILALATWLHFEEKAKFQLAKVVFLISFLPSLALQVADLVFFPYFFERLNAGVFLWFDDPAMIVKMLFTEKSYIAGLVGGALCFTFFIWIINKFTQRFNQKTKPSIKKQLSSILLIAFLPFSLSLISLKPSQNDFFLQKIMLNPVKTFFDSIKIDFFEAPIPLTDKELIEKLASENFYQTEDENLSLIGDKKHIVLVIMESMSARNMQRFGAKSILTPNLDAIANDSISFDAAYTHGTHTFNGVFSTIFSLTTPTRIHPMKQKSINTLPSLFNQLKRYDYQGLYFTTHGEEFDNVGPFLREHGIDQIYSEKDYPKEQLTTLAMGVADHYLFDFAFEKMQTLSSQNKKFISVILTGSNHNPYTIPQTQDYKAPYEELSQNIVHYADWSIGRLVDKIKLSDWYQDALIVLVADHGISIAPNYPLALSYYHTPLIFHAKEVPPIAISKLASQLDIFPSIMKTIDPDWQNETQGIDLFSQRRKYLLLNHDRAMATLSEDYLFILTDLGERMLFRYQSGDKENYVERQSDVAQEMQDYLRVMTALGRLKFD